VKSHPGDLFTREQYPEKLRIFGIAGRCFLQRKALSTGW